ncbi:MAG: helix-turn-helix domain-containing protein, partial [Bacteroidales bacterium]
MEEKTTFRKICQHCGREFTAYTSVTAYCSTRCANLADKLKKRNERLRETQADVLEMQRLALLDKNYLTLSDAARLLQVSRNTLYRIIRDNKVPLLRFTDRTVRISREELER